MVAFARQRTKKLLRHPLTAFLLCSHLVFFSIFILRGHGGFQSAELFIYDQHRRVEQQKNANIQRIAVIGISEQDLHDYGWPLTDQLFLQLLNKLIAVNPAAVGVDIYRDIPIAPGTDQLSQLLRAQPNIVWINLFQKHGLTRGIAPPAILAGSDQVGFNDIIPDAGGIVRRGLLFLDDGKDVAVSLSLRLAMKYLEPMGIVPMPSETNPEHIKLGPSTITPFDSNDGGYVKADAGGYQLLIDYENSRPYITFTLGDILSDAVSLEDFRGKVVLVGSLAESSNDIFHTPLSRSGDMGRPPLHGVGLHATIVDQLLRLAFGESQPIRTTTNVTESVWIWLWCLVGGLVALSARGVLSFSLMIACAGLILLSLSHLAMLNGWWIPFVPPAAGGIGSGALLTAYLSGLEKSERTLLMQLFSRHVSADVAQDIWQRRDEFLVEGRLRPTRLTATVLFTDLKGFTSISENMDPQRLLNWLNNYMESMSEEQMRFGGVIDKYIGDAVMAVFGVPFSGTLEKDIELNALNAVKCALSMSEALDRLNAEWQKNSLPTIGMRIGICTGPLVAGSLGSAQRMDYTVIGDTVNTAARLESYDKNLGAEIPCRILISDSTLKLLHGRFLTERVGEVSLKGKSERITIHLVTGHA